MTSILVLVALVFLLDSVLLTVAVKKSENATKLLGQTNSLFFNGFRLTFLV